MNNIQNINGEYLKFYFTYNPSMPNILKNTGAVTILHKNAENYSYNELWVADEFIATGFGLGSSEIKQVMDKYGNTYITYEGENYDSYIDYKFDEANRAYISSINYTDDLRNDINTYFVNNIGDASGTYIVFEDSYIKLSYFPYLHDVAEYEDAKVKSTHVELYGYEYITNNFNKGNKIIDDYYTNSDKFYLPIGSKISRIKVDSEVVLNNVSPQNHKINVGYISNSIYNENFTGTDFINHEYTYLFAYKDNSLNVSSDIHHITIDTQNTQYSNLNCIIKEGVQAIVSSYVEYEGTKEYAYYPALASYGNVYIYSKEKAIKPNIYSLGTVYVEGCFEITYLGEAELTSSAIKQLHPATDGSSKYNHKMIIDNKVHINVNKGYTYFGIPKCFSIIDAKWVHLSNLSQKHHESYMNWVGDIYKDASNSYNNMRCHIAYNTDNNSHYKYINYDHYVTYLPEKTTLYLEFRNDEVTNNILFSRDNGDNGEEISTYDFQITDNFVQNEFYNSSHWFKPIDLTYMYIR